MDFTAARALFPGLNDKIFLDAACVSLAPITTRAAIEQFLHITVFCEERDASAHHTAMDSWRQHTLEDAATLFNIAQTRLALVESTTHGLNIAANAIPWACMDEVIIADTEFLQVAIPFAQKQAQGILRVVPLHTSPEGFSFSDLEKLMTPRTKALCLSSVQWCTGERLPMEAIGDLCRARSIWLIVDGVQEAGALKVDLQKRHADFFIAGGHKWLNSPFGCGIMALSPRALELKPPSFGYLALEAPVGGWGTYFQDPTQTPFRDYQFAKTAKRFEIAGTSNYPGGIALGASIKIINALGIDRVEDRVLTLARLLQNELLKLDLKLITPKAPQAHSGITIFAVPGGEKEQLALLEKLLDQRVLCSLRYTAQRGGIRLSTHYFNNEDDVYGCIAAIKRGLMS